MLAILQKISASPEAREQASVFTSHLLLNASFFVIMLLASVTLPPSEFAELSLANNWIILLATAFGFGMDQISLKLSFENRNNSYIAINLFVKAGLFATTLVLLLINALFFTLSTSLVVVAAGAGVAFWASTRVVEQYERRFSRLAWLNIAFAATRVGFGGAAIATSNWLMIAVALHIVAQLPIHIATVATVMRDLHSKIEWRSLRAMLTMSPLTFASVSLFSALALITQGILHSRGEVLATSAFGVALIFIAPLSVLIGTFRIYVLPQVLSRNLKEIDIFGLGEGSFHLVVVAFTTMLILGILPAAAAIHWIYSDRLPLAGPFFLIYFGAQAVTMSVGLYNIRAQRRKLLRVDLLANMGRAAATASLALFPALGPLGIVAWSAAILIAGELALAATLTWAESRREAS